VEERGTNPGDSKGGEEVVRWIRYTATEILDKYAKMRVCARSKRWWNDEITEP